MADTTALKNRIRAAVKANDNQEITGPVLQQALLDIVDELNSGTEAEALTRSDADTALQQGITAEKTRAEGAEQTLSDAINTEKTRAEGAEQTLSDAINTEKTRAEGAEQTLQQNITAEKDRAEGVEQTLQQNITAEKDRAEGVEQTLQQNITAEKDRAEAAENALSQRITNEEQAREDAFSDLDLIDAAGSEVSPNAIDLTLRKNDGTEEDPDYRTLTHLLLPSVTTEKAGLMSTVLLALLNNLKNEGYKFKGVVTTNTNPGNPSINCFYIAVNAGTYTYFKNEDNESIILENSGIYVFIYDAVENQYWEANSIINIDDEPTAESDNLITSGGVKAANNAMDLRISHLEDKIDGGIRYYANEEITLNNDWANYLTLYAELSEAIDGPFKWKFITPEGVTITAFGVRLYEEDGTTFHSYQSSVAPNEEGTANFDYKVSKFAINQVTPDQRYTGTFKLQVWKETESSLDSKVDKTSIVQTIGNATDKVMSQKATTDAIDAVDVKAESAYLAVNGGMVVLGDSVISVNNEYVSSNNLYAALSENVRSIVIRLNTPAGTSITGYNIYLYKLDDTIQSLGPYTPNTDVSIERNFDIKKVAVSMLIPDARYTGEFELKVTKVVARSVATRAEVSKVEENLEYDKRESIPAYYFTDNYLDNKISTIKALLERCMANGDAFFFQTDCHWDKNAQHSPALIHYIANALQINKLFDGGDLIQTINKYGVNGTLNEDFIDFVNLRVKTLGKKGRVFNVIGNHEYLTAAYSTANLYDNVDFGNWHDYALYEKQDTGDFVFGDVDKHYYYVDNPRKKIRYIILSSYKKKETPISSGGSYYTIAENDYSNEQLTWFTTTALNVESGWTILVFAHDFYGGTHGTKSEDGYYESFTPQIITAAKPFAQAMLQYSGNGIIAGVFCGHTHYDCLFEINDSYAGLPSGTTDKTIPCINTTCDAYNFDSLGFNEKLFNRTVNTITEQAFDVVVLNKTARKFTMVRIGAPAYDMKTPDENGHYLLYGDLEVREVTY